MHSLSPRLAIFLFIYVFLGRLLFMAIAVLGTCRDKLLYHFTKSVIQLLRIHICWNTRCLIGFNKEFCYWTYFHGLYSRPTPRTNK